MSEGQEQQFLDSIDFFSNQEAKIKQHYPQIDISYVFSPGNHDCDISTSHITEEIRNLKEDLKKPGNLDRYLDAVKKENNQKNYYQFCQLYRNPYMLEQKSFKEVFRVFNYNHANGSIRFISINSSLYFNKTTEQGDVYVDVETIEKNIFAEENSINILVSHYPIEWYNRLNIEKVGQFVNSFHITIVGHEHFGDAILKGKNHRQQIEIKNPQFNSSNQQIITGLYLIHIKPQSYSIDVSLFNYTGDLFDIVIDKSLTHTIKTNGVSNQIATLNQDNHRDIYYFDALLVNNKDVTLESLYVDVPLRYSSNPEKPKPDNQYDECEFHYVSTGEVEFIESNLYGFYGVMASGKSTLLKRAYTKLFAEGYMPILVDGSILNRNLSAESLKQILLDKYSKQYASSNEVFKQNPKKVVILIDNLHEIQDYDVKKFVINTLIDQHHSVIFSSAISYQSTDYKMIGSQIFLQYEMLELGQIEIYELCENWMRLCGELESPNYHPKLVSIKAKVNALSINKCVPLTPFFILLIVKACTENYSADLENSHKRVYYEYLISSLIIDISELIKLTKNDIHVHFTEMAYFSYIHDNPNFNEFVIYMQNKYSYDSEYTFLMRDFKNILISKRVINFDKHIFSFQYQFMFYTFLAQFITENIEENPIDFDRLFEDIIKDRNANILLFLSQYYAKKSIILKVVEKADSLLNTFREIKLNSSDLEIYNHFITGIKEVEKYGNVRENHKKLLKKIDKKERSESSKPMDYNEMLEKLDKQQKQVIEAIKIINICNELLFNRLSSELTKTLVTSSISLGRRVLSFLTLEYIKAMDNFYKEVEKGESKDSLECSKDDLNVGFDIVKSMTTTFIRLLIHLANNLGDYKNIHILDQLQIDETNILSIIKFVVRLKDSDQMGKINIEEVKMMLVKFERGKNYLLKGLVHSVLDYQLNYVGLVPKHIIAISTLLQLSQNQTKKLLAKSTSTS